MGVARGAAAADVQEGWPGGLVVVVFSGVARGAAAAAEQRGGPGGLQLLMCRGGDQGGCCRCC